MNLNVNVKRLMLFLFILVILACPAIAQQGRIKLLAVSETTAGFTGSIAYLELDIQPGSDRIFIDTYPTAKIDTQLSTRFAKDMACKYLNIDCSNLDFFYTIRAGSPIVGGPSAGAAITALTISLLKGIHLDENIAITGTINSGELIGPVGGVKEKIDAAINDGVTSVLIPQGERMLEIDNESIDMIEYGNSRNITVIEVSNVDDVLYYYTGQYFNDSNSNVEISPMYKDTMRFLSDELCQRSKELEEDVSEFRVKNASLIDADFAENKKKAENLSIEGKIAFKNEHYYSAASYCFGANVKFNSLLFRLKEMSRSDINKTITGYENEIKDMNDKLDNFEIKTITDLQAYMIVKDRLEESEDFLNKSRIALANNGTTLNDDLAFAIERYNSAGSWSNFLGQRGKKFKISDSELMVSCLNKISEAEEQYNYVDYLFPGILGDVRKEIDTAKQKYEQGDYVLCLYKATLAKAHVGIVSSSIGVKKENLDELLNRKLGAAKKLIIKQQENGIFPLLGYSYYEYGTSLKDKDVFSSLLYAEQALELTNLDIYFEPDKIFMTGLESSDIFIFTSGIAIGLMLALLVIFLEKHAKRFRSKPMHKKIKFKFKKR